MFSLLPGCATEAWSFESAAIESDKIWLPTRCEAPALDKLIQGIHASRKPPRASPSSSLVTILHHVVSAGDPVNAIAGGTTWSAERALREFAGRTLSITPAQVAKVISGADPFCEDGTGALSAVCGALGVGLIVQSAPKIRVIKICPEKNVWLERRGNGNGDGDEWQAVPWCTHPVNKVSAEALIRERCRICAENPLTGIKELREIAELTGINRPYPRTKAALAELLLSRRFVPAILETLGDLKKILESREARSHKSAIELAHRVDWQVETLNSAVQMHYAAIAPLAVELEDTEWLAVAIRSADVLSYNLIPRVLRFPVPLVHDGEQSWEALRQQIPYIAFIKNGSRHFLCRVESSEDRVCVTKLISKEKVLIDPGTRLKWRGENLRSRLRSGIYTYVVVFVSDRGSSEQAFIEDERHSVLHGVAWTRASTEMYAKNHGEPPAPCRIKL